MKRILYLGLDVPHNTFESDYVHYPLIEIIAYPPETPSIVEAFQELGQYTHLIFTSKSAVVLFFQYLSFYHYSVSDLQNKIFITVGEKTALKVKEYGCLNVLIAENECAEGIIELLETLSLEKAYLFWPHSQRSRPIINTYLKDHSICFKACFFYNTQTKFPSFSIDFKEFDEIVFTSPSTVSAFLEVFSQFPKNITLTSIGSVTQKVLFETLAKVKK